MPRDLPAFRRRNLIRNTEWLGGFAGSPGVLPTEVETIEDPLLAGNGLASQVVQVADSAGRRRLDWRLFGAAADAGSVALCLTTFQNPWIRVASIGEEFTFSCFVQQVGTASAPPRLTLQLNEYAEAGGFLNVAGQFDIAPPTGAAVRSISTSAPGSGSTHTFDLPAGAAAGDRLVVAIKSGGVGGAPPVLTPPSGWTAIGTNPHSVNIDSNGYCVGIYLLYRDLGAGEPATYSWTGSADTEGVMYCLTGVDPATAPKVSSDNTGSDVSPSVANSVTAATDNCWGAHIAYCWHTASGSSPPAGFIERYEGALLYAADRAYPAGATGTSAATHPNNFNAGSGGQDFWGAVKVVVETTAGDLSAHRLQVSGRVASPFTTRVLPLIGFYYDAGQSFDLTLGLALPQLERGPRATAPQRRFT